MAFRRFEILDVRTPSFLEHDATQIRVLTSPNIENKDSLEIEKLLIYKNAEKKQDIIEASGVSEDNIIEVDNRDLLREYEFNLNFEKSDIYYVTYNIWYNDVTSAGWARPNMVTRDTDGYSANNVEIITPILKVNTDPNNAELGGFNIITTPFRTFLGTAKHKYTSWYIEDFTGNVIWKRERDSVNLTSIRIPNNILALDSIYTIKAIHFSDSNVPSNPGKLVIKTKGELSEVEKALFGASAKAIQFGHERPIVTGGKDSLEVIENALDEAIHRMTNTAILNGNLKLVIEKLNKQLAEVNNEVANLQAKLKQATTDKQNLQKLLEDKEKLIQQLQQELKKLEQAEKEIALLKDLNKDKDSIIIKLDSQIDRLKNELNKTIRLLNSKEDDYNKLIEAYKKVSKEMHDLHDTLEKSLEVTISYALKSGSYIVRIENLEEELKNERNRINELKQQLEQCENNLNNCKHENQELKQYIKVLETEAVPSDVFDKAMGRVIELTINNALLKACCNNQNS